MRRKITPLAVLQKLSTLYHPPKTFLHFRTPLELLIVTLLSAQCTDKKVNEVTPGLFRKFGSAKAFAKADISKLEASIRSTGFYRTKARHIQMLCRMLLEKHGGNVPSTLEELTALPGVGRKTAAIILTVIFGKNEYIAVDTHVFRVARRLGLSRGKNPDKVAGDLMRGLPRKDWGRITPLLISHGRAICTAKNR
ncbi:MAG: endonuclease III, partial [Patescibacteria group bacterium]